MKKYLLIILLCSPLFSEISLSSDNIQVILDKDKITATESVILTVKVPRILYAQYKVEKGTSRQIIERDSKPIAEVGEIKKTETLDFYEITIPITFFRAGREKLPRFTLNLTKKDKTQKKFETPGHEISISSLLQNDKSDFEVSDVLDIEKSYKLVIWVLSIALTVSILLYVFRKKLAHLISSIYLRKAQATKIVYVKSSPEQIYNNFVKKMQKLAGNYYGNEPNFLELFASLEANFIEFLSELFKFEASNYALSQVVFRMEKLNIRVSNNVASELKETFSFLTLVKYAKRIPLKNDILTHHARLEHLAKQLFEENFEINPVTEGITAE